MIRLFLLAALLCLAPPIAQAQNIVWSNLDDTETVGAGLTAAQLDALYDREVGSGKITVHIDGYSVQGIPYFNVVFRRMPRTPYSTYWHVSGSRLKQLVDEGYKGGRCLTSLDLYMSGTKPLYTFTMNGLSCSQQHYYFGHDSKKHQSKFEELTAKGFATVAATAISQNSKTLYAAFFTAKSYSFWLKSFQTREQFSARHAELSGKGFALSHVDTYKHGPDQSLRISATWKKRAAPDREWLFVSASELRAIARELANEKSEIQFLAGYGRDGGHRYLVGVSLVAIEPPREGNPNSQ